MKINPYQQYKQTQFETASSEKLILMLYEGALKNLYQAQKGLENNDLEVVNQSLTKTQDIISELMVSLDMDTGEIAQNLYQLYDYMQYRLIQANIHKKGEPITEVIGMLEELHDTWKKAMLNVQKNNPAGNQAQGGILLEG